MFVNMSLVGREQWLINIVMSPGTACIKEFMRGKWGCASESRHNLVPISEALTLSPWVKTLERRSRG